MTETTRDNKLLNSAGLREDPATPGAMDFAFAFDYHINGRTYRKAATPGLTFTAGHKALAIGETCAIFVMVDAAGAVTTSQSNVMPAITATGYIAGAFDWPNPIDKAVAGAVLVRAIAAAFTPGTTDLSAAGVVASFVQSVSDYGLPVAY